MCREMNSTTIKIVIPFGVVHYATLNNYIHETREIIKVRDGDSTIFMISATGNEWIKCSEDLVLEFLNQGRLKILDRK